MIFMPPHATSCHLKNEVAYSLVSAITQDSEFSMPPYHLFTIKSCLIEIDGSRTARGEESKKGGRWHKKMKNLCVVWVERYATSVLKVAYFSGKVA